MLEHYDRTRLAVWASIAVFAILFVNLSYTVESIGDRQLNSGDRKLNPKLLALKPNIWVKLYQPAQKNNWYRQSHAGIAYDARRGTILIFGSDTHGSDWDNEIHEFDPVAEKWVTHYQRAGKESYRVDAAGNAISGNNKLLPWAMHVYDTIIYDPTMDALVVTGSPEHNPMLQTVQGIKMHPTWIYDLKAHDWKIFDNKGRKSPNFFAAASVYDPERDVIVAYSKHGIWEIGPERDEWKMATNESHHEIHFMMGYDTKQRKIAVFGDYHDTNDVWVYTPGSKAGGGGRWEKKTPGGDTCPQGQHFPLSFDADNAVFLLVPDNWYYTKDEKGQVTGKKRVSSSTFVYDLNTNRYYKLPHADLGPLGMNYMMVYDRFHRVFLLVTGDYSVPPTVWALKLELKKDEKAGSAR
jgi:hypothetical protein